jgi:hypothetical protein
LKLGPAPRGSFNGPLTALSPPCARSVRPIRQGWRWWGALGLWVRSLALLFGGMSVGQNASQPNCSRLSSPQHCFTWEEEHVLVLHVLGTTACAMVMLECQHQGSARGGLGLRGCGARTDIESSALFQCFLTGTITTKGAYVSAQLLRELLLWTYGVGRPAGRLRSWQGSHELLARLSPCQGCVSSNSTRALVNCSID